MYFVGPPIARVVPHYFCGLQPKNTEGLVGANNKALIKEIKNQFSELPYPVQPALMGGSYA